MRLMTFRETRHGNDGDQAHPAMNDDADEADDPRLYCAACGHEVTRTAWALTLAGDHIHRCVNPLGVAFTVRLFTDAPGARPVGAASSRATWFAGYTWRMTACGGCRVHIGWLYEGSMTPNAFFGLIADALTDAPR